MRQVATLDEVLRELSKVEDFVTATCALAEES